MALLLVEKEKTLAKLKHDINKDVERKVQEQHRKYLLNEQVFFLFFLFSMQSGLRHWMFLYLEGISTLLSLEILIFSLRKG